MTGGTVEDSLATRAGRLFSQYRNGDEAQMAELVKILTPILWHTARASRLDAAAAEDVLQTVWLTLVRKADTITEPLAVLQWLVVTTKREAWRVARTQARVRPEDLEASGALPSDPTESVEDEVLRANSAHSLWQHVEALPERCRALLRVIAFAEELEQHVGTLRQVETRFQRRTVGLLWTPQPDQRLRLVTPSSGH